MSIARRRLLTTTDDRGDLRELATLADPYGGVPIADPRMSALRSRVRPILSAAIGPVFVIAIFSATLVHAAVVGWFGVSGPARFLFQGGLFGGAVMLAGAVIRRHMLAAAPRITAEYLRDGVCPACGYNLFGLVVAEDGCLNCPECGAAWRAERIQVAQPFDESRPPTLLERRREMLLPRQTLDRRMGADDRGSRVELVTARHLRTTARKHTGDASRRTHRAASRIRARGRTFRWIAAGFFAAVSAVPVLGLLAVGFPPLGLMWLPLLFGVGSTLALAIIVARSELGSSSRTIIAAARDQRLCAACGDDLDNVPAAADGCTVCPRCAAAWRLPDRRS